MYKYIIFLFIFIFYFNVRKTNSYQTLNLITKGFDIISLFGSNIVYNNDFIFVSANGYNIYNGIILVYKNNISNEIFYKKLFIN